MPRDRRFYRGGAPTGGGGGHGEPRCMVRGVSSRGCNACSHLMCRCSPKACRILTTAVPSPAPWSWDRGVPMAPHPPCPCLGPGSLPSPSLPHGDLSARRDVMLGCFPLADGSVPVVRAPASCSPWGCATSSLLLRGKEGSAGVPRGWRCPRLQHHPSPLPSAVGCGGNCFCLVIRSTPQPSYLYLRC